MVGTLHIHDIDKVLTCLTSITELQMIFHIVFKILIVKILNLAENLTNLRANL